MHLSARGVRLPSAQRVLEVVPTATVWLIITAGANNTRTHSSASASNAPSRHAAKRAVVSPSSVSVAVLNGTAALGLAHRVGLHLAGDGYKEGTIATATDQTHASTVVAYLPGFKRDAQAVATSLKLGPSTVQPVDQSTQAVACPPPAACNANVVVTVGSDLTNIP